MDINAVMVREILSESMRHALLMAPVLLLVFILMEAVSHGAKIGFISSALRHPLAGPLAGAGLGLLPQCGFSVASTMLYVEGLIPTGSLLASYIATSDEAVPLLVANPATLPFVLPLLATKMVLGVSIGIGVNALDKVLRVTRTGRRRGAAQGIRSGDARTEGRHTDHFEENSGQAHRQEARTRERRAGRLDENLIRTRHEVAPQETRADSVHWDHRHGGQHHGGSCVGEKAGLRDYIPHALHRTARTVAMVFVLSAVLELIGDIAYAHMPNALAASSSWQPLAASIVGLLPSCATSVALAEGFRSGLVSFPALMAGLTANSGMGLAVLLQESRSKARVLYVVILLIASAYLAGVVTQVLF